MRKPRPASFRFVFTQSEPGCERTDQSEQTVTQSQMQYCVLLPVRAYPSVVFLHKAGDVSICRFHARMEYVSGVR